MKLPVTFLPDAEEEYMEATAWYAKQKKGLGKKFSKAVKATLKQIQATPKR